jgi:hypothetical protein
MILVDAAILSHFGNFTVLGILALLAAAACLIAAAAPHVCQRRTRSNLITVVCAATGILNLINLLFMTWQVGPSAADRHLLAAIPMAILLVATVGACLRRDRAARPLLAVATAAWVGTVVLTWDHWGHTVIDVFYAITGATSTLIAGSNPYTPTFKFLAPVASGHVLAHFPYEPAVLLLSLPGRLVGDVRSSNVIALLTIVAALGALAHQHNRGPFTVVIVALALASPLAIPMEQSAWVETYIAAGVLWWLALRNAHPRWSLAPLATALLVTPVSLIVLAPFFVRSARARREILLAGAIALLATVPFALMTGVSPYLHDIIGIQMALPPRYDALTLTTWFHSIGIILPWWLPALTGVGALTAAALDRRDPTPAATARWSALIIIAVFVVAKWAYFDYYFLAAMMILASLALEAELAPPSFTAGLAKRDTDSGQRSASATDPSMRLHVSNRP